MSGQKHAMLLNRKFLCMEVRSQQAGRFIQSKPMSAEKETLIMTAAPMNDVEALNGFLGVRESYGFVSRQWMDLEDPLVFP